jgi:hypothetical protein
MSGDSIKISFDFDLAERTVIHSFENSSSKKK